MLEGVKQSAKSSKYVLFLDDDVRAHPQLIGHLQAALEDDPKVFLVTGYPLDLMPSGGNLWAHAVAAFHLVLVPAMSHGRTFFAWGGCMMFRRDDLARDAYGLVSAWRNGGYSDDLIAGTKCVEHGLKIACPEAAHMFQPLDREWTRAKFWNYIRRQMFVLTTYTNPFSRRFHALLLFTNALFFATIILGLAVSALAALPFEVLPTGLEFAPVHHYLSVVVLSTALASLAALGLMHRVAVSASAAWLRQPKGLQFGRFDWKLIALGFLTMAAASPPAALLGALRDTIVWSGIAYTRRRGLVARVRPLQ
jgi:cellulose synthase/poly-beta-1,6-N-acetylglucosamine synthase-like glycosyltransferase